MLTPDETTRTAIADLRRRFEAAENAGDPEPIIAGLADDAVLMVPTFPVSTGKEQCAAFLRELLPGLLEYFDRRITYTSDEVAVRGDLAVDRGLFMFTVQPRAGGEMSTERGKYVFMSVKDGAGSWRLWRGLAILDERDERRPVLRHFLAALAYRTQKALRDAPEAFGDFCIAPGTRTPRELVRHMTSVLGYARTRFHGGSYRPEPLPTLAEEITRFHQMLEDLSRDLTSDIEISEDSSVEQLLQGPLADAMTHAGQLAMLRRLAGSPVPPENFIVADIRPDRLGPEQAAPASPDNVWPEAPMGWRPPGS